MAFKKPKPEDVKLRYPEFTSVPDARVALAIEDATRWVDETWTEADYTIALRCMAAHLLVSEGALDGGRAAQVGALVSDKLGDASQTYATRSSQSKVEGIEAELASTSYGQRFLELRRANHPAVAVV